MRIFDLVAQLPAHLLQGRFVRNDPALYWFYLPIALLSLAWLVIWFIRNWKTLFRPTSRLRH
jgi:hypothetical protein